MKKTIYFLIGLILAGTLAYFAAYYTYTMEFSEAEKLEPMTLQKAAPIVEEKSTPKEEAYYLAKIEQDMLLIYRMPEKALYDSIRLSSLYFTEKEQPELMKGKIFQDLTEVFEFLENSMS